MDPDYSQDLANTQALADAADTSSGILLAIVMVGYLWFALMMITSMMGVFIKAGKPWWAALVPIYNTIVLLEIAGKPIWWVVMMFIPIVNLVFTFMAVHALVTSFGKDVGFTLGIIFLPFVFLPMLAFGSAQYRGAVA